MKKLIAFGDANVDLVVEIPHSTPARSNAPPPDAALMGGGTVANTAAGTARLGVPTRFVGKVGLDGYGRFLREGFEADGIDTSFMIEDPAHFTIMVLAFIDAAGEKHNVAFPREGGAHHQIRVEEIDPAVWQDAIWFYTSGMSIGEDPCRSTTLEMMRRAGEKGLTVSFDLNLRLEYFGWRPHVRESVLEAMALSHVVFASVEDELQPLTGRISAAGCVDALEHLYPSGPSYARPNQQIIIARQGGRPAQVFNRGSCFESPCFQVNVVDALGAGDAFNAGYIAA
ncbi:MAG: hypothetical protein CSA81_02545 [Acidobacteria bacterium]|nr:MAG: hypothetical protein CSA81_02545 [Acidobacteriota bacterium]